MKVSTLIVVADLQEAKHFYVNLMGLAIIGESGSRLDLDASGHEIHVFESEGEARPYSHSSDASSNLVFWVEDVSAKQSELEKLGYKFIHSNENEFSKYAAFFGPSGIVHEISESKGNPESAQASD
ncbi:MAG: VOC family protein [Gammaproteobacteria bacterium]